jgi:UDP-N-acetylglucosamine 4-epimerase
MFSLSSCSVARWGITGVGGFIGSHVLQTLLHQNCNVVGIDDFTTGHEANLEAVRAGVSEAQWAGFHLVRGDVSDPRLLDQFLRGVHVVLHLAALVSVPASILNPTGTHRVNVTGFLELLEAARRCGVRRLVYASSSAVYGDMTELPSREDRIGQPLSPYALSKRINEQYAALYERCYGLVSVGLRYFNVFGPRQDPRGAYAAVIPQWIQALSEGRDLIIHGDGETTRDFCPVSQVVEANLRAATVELPSQAPRVYNIGLGRATSLKDLAAQLQKLVSRRLPMTQPSSCVHGPPRPGDVRHSRADVSLARRWLGLEPGDILPAELERTVDYFANHIAKDQGTPRK